MNKNQMNQTLDNMKGKLESIMPHAFLKINMPKFNIEEAHHEMQAINQLKQMDRRNNGSPIADNRKLIELGVKKFFFVNKHSRSKSPPPDGSNVLNCLPKNNEQQLYSTFTSASRSQHSSPRNAF